MGLFGRRPRVENVSDLSSDTRKNEIKRLETDREELNREIEKLLVTYRRLTGDKEATRGAVKIGKSKKDYSYWHKEV